MSFSEQELEEFKTEALELLDAAEKSLIKIDQGDDFRSSFDSVFRGFHNLKGSAGMMELHALQTHTHELETIFMGFKDRRAIPKGHISFFLRGVDAARSILHGEKITFEYTVKAEPVLDATPPPTAAVKSAVAVPAAVPVAAAPPPVLAAPSPIPEPLPVAGGATLAPEAALPDSVRLEFVAECEEIVERVALNLQLLESGTHTRDSIDSLYRDVHSLKGAAFLFSFAKLGAVGHAMESSLEPIRDGTHFASPILIDALFDSLRLIESFLSAIRSQAPDTHLHSQVDLVASILGTAASVLDPVPEKTEVKMDPAPNIAPVAPEASAAPEPTPAPPAPVSETAAPHVEAGATTKEAEGASSIRVPVSLLDNLMTLMGEMVLVRNQVLQFSNKSEDLEFLSMSKRLNVVTTEIQGEMMKTRMQPIGNVLTKFNRVVRDLSQELSKNLNITLQGADTELDKSLLEAIKDPLTHIVRNSCDHGIETPEVRRKSGKPEVGTIAIKAYHEGGQVVIEITDDGKGLHKDMLVNKAIEKGVLTTIQAAKMTEKEIFNLIFAPGFSTAAKITNVSGRGVGMDVVRTNIERIGGTVDLASEAGRGTQIKIKIPLTLAIVPALLVKCGTGTFAIPQVKLEELVRVDQSSGDNRIEYLHGSPVYRLRGNILPLVDLNKILGTRPGGENPDPTIINIAVLNAEQCSFGVIIDEVQDTADIVVKPLNRLLKSLQVYSGATVLGDGSIALIFDVLGLSKVAQLGHSKEKNQASNNALAEKTRKLTELQDFLLVRLNSATKHAIVLNYVNRLEEFKTTDIELSGNQRVIRYRDLILPLISASEQLGYPRNDAKTETKPVVVIQRAGAFYGIEVEEILDTLSTDSEVDAGVVKQPGIFGNLNTKEELIVVVDPFELINRCFPDMNSSNGIETMLQTSNVKQIQPPQNAIIAARASGRVLLVEDTVFFRKAIKSVLEKTGYEVITANDGREALEILNKQGSAFDVIVSDIEMPRMNGFQLAEQVRHHPVYANIGMLAVSSRADSKSMTEGSKAGFDLYLEKLKPAVLISAVEQVMKKRKSAA